METMINLSPSLDIILGPMYSGKSTELLRRLNIFAEMGLKVLFINSDLDTRSENGFSTHNNLLKSNIKGINFQKLKNLDILLSDEIISNYQIIGIDEAQMFDNLKIICLKLVETHNKKIIISGLNGDFKRNKFGQILDLIPYCDNISKLNPFCEICCKKYNTITPALFSKRIIDSQDFIVIGGKSSYIPVCRKCYL